jgi:hypothetical protein
MARLRFRLEVKRDAKGILLHKLANLADETLRFLGMVAEDIEAEPFKRDWLAVEFYNSSVGFDLEFEGEADEDQARLYSRAVRQIASYEPKRTTPERLGLRKETILQYARIGEQLEPTESINLGFYENGEHQPLEWRSHSKRHAVAVTEALEQIVEYHGMIQGIVHSLYKESEPPYFDVRELSGQQIVKCVYRPDNYRQVVDLLRNKDAVVLISGTVKARRIDRRIQEIRVEKMRATEPLSDDEFNRLRGSAPNLTGDISTAEFIERSRRTERNGGD